MLAEAYCNLLGLSFELGCCVGGYWLLQYGFWDYIGMLRRLEFCLELWGRVFGLVLCVVDSLQVLGGRRFTFADL